MTTSDGAGSETGNGSSPPPETPPSLSINLVADATLGYASIQNHVPVVRSIELTNTGAGPLRDLQVLVRTDPAFAQPLRVRFEALAPGEHRLVTPVDLSVEHAYLAQLNELERARICVEVLVDGVVVTQAERPVEVLAYDQWPGMRALPELLGAFCMPNSSVVDGLLASASQLLRSGGGVLSMNGYQSKDRKTVWQQLAAIYGAIAAQQLHYSEPPASFGTAGQKIRTPNRILSGKVATCLDITMLVASCVEQAGLHPVVLFQAEHAWVGAWLVDTSFQLPTIDDVQAVRKRVKAGEMVVFETTLLANERPPPFSVAATRGLEHLDEEAAFRFAVDIARCREQRILPLPAREAGPARNADVTNSPATSIEAPPELPPLTGDAIQTVDLDSLPDTPAGRLARWKSKLLDLTLRNRLLSFKASKSNLQLQVPDLAHFEDVLSEGTEFKFRPLPKIMEGADPRVSAVHVNRTGRQPIEEMAKDAIARRELLALVESDKLDERLLDMYSAAQLGIREGGSNTLYVAVGFLRWNDPERGEQTYLAPLLLIPVSMTRTSVRGGFRLTRHDDETLLNPTLVHMLREHFSLQLKGIDPLPTDGKGVDVARVLQIFREAVIEMPKWEVIEHVHLGIFSFAKYLMWKDLADRTADLKKNRVVAHLIDNPGKSFPRGGDVYEARDLDEKLKPQDLFAPLVADSSQLQAVCNAANGHDMVIEGPPGTGKSQTITNLIAHFLATGKSVLFVSEKMTALEVVRHRLEKLGLGPFCLELHSAKARKAEVIGQLDRALKASGTRTVDEWNRVAESVSELRQGLNGVVRALHHEHRNGLTVFAATGLSVLKAEWKAAPMPWADPQTHGRVELDGLRETSRQIGALASAIGSLAGHPLASVSRSEWSPTWEDELIRACEALDAAAAALEASGEHVAKLCGFAPTGLGRFVYEGLDGLADVLLRSPAVPSGLAQKGHDPATRVRLQAIRTHNEARKTLWSTLAGSYREDVATQEGTALTAAWKAASSTWWPKRWFDQRKVRGSLTSYRLDAKRPDVGEMEALLATLCQLNAEDRALREIEPDAIALLDKTYAAVETDWNAVARHEIWLSAMESALARVCGVDVAKTTALRNRLLPLLGQHRALLMPGAPIATKLVEYRNAWRTFSAALTALETLAEAAGRLDPDAAAGAVIPRVRAAVQGWIGSRRRLRDWCNWRRIRAKAITQGLIGIVASCETGAIGLGDIPDFFEYSYQDWWLRRNIDRDPVLRTFSSADHARKIKEFRSADEKFEGLTQSYIAAKLLGRIPTAHEQAGPDSEMGRLRREITKTTRHLPVRQLIQGLPTLLPKLKPCLLMSPLSVAQYLDAKHPPFDLVVFDEASQIPVWDAVGAIARGRQLIVVGDPKQLPPTNFFNRTEDDDEAGPQLEEEIKDLDSILEECLGSGLRPTSLEWHYRSRYESLITFSNVRYYDSRLITFPSPITSDRAVEFRRIPGVYDRGGTRTNRAEAQAIVAEIEAHTTDPLCRSRSVGVVTFNEPQMTLINNLLDARRRANQEFDRILSEQKDEPLLVRNLENIQGDERDIILFSITYGPDAAGRQSMAFGPLNLQGGPRRLNVAVSRARERVIVFSSIASDQIDLARTSAAGVRDLKDYLDFASRGVRALTESSHPTGGEPDSPFEVVVIRALRNKGWTTHSQVGVSGYRIDIGVVDPRAPGRYLLGVECDGRTYHSAATARDRDRLRQSVLERLGWKLHRIWSTDWWLDSGRQIEELDALLKRLVEEPLRSEEPARPGESAAKVPETAEGAASPVEAPVASPPPPALPVYRSAAPTGGPAQDFYLPPTNRDILQAAREVVRLEGPVSEKILHQKIARAWGLQRTGTRIVERIRLIVDGKFETTREDGEAFLWPEGSIPTQWTEFRVADSNEESKRHVQDVAIQEIANIASHLLLQYGSTSVAELSRGVCRLLGMARTPADAEARVESVLHGLARQGKVRLDADRVYPPS